MAYGCRLVRPSRLVAGAALTAALALVAMPGLAGSWSPARAPQLPAAAFHSVSITANTARSGSRIGALDAADRSAGHLAADATFLEPGTERPAPAGRPDVRLPSAPVASEARPPRSSMSGYASFYDHGTTAVRLPRGTLVVICGGGGCIERVVTDYGPSKSVHPDRVADLYRADFFRICGCPSFSGTTWVTVNVY
jgi:hypothetical protein